MSTELLDHIPHRGPMRLLSGVLEVGAEHLVAEAEIGDDHILLSSGEVSPLVSLELFAQTAAVWMAHRAAEGGVTRVSGALLGTRRLDVHVDAFHVGDTLRVEVRQVWGAGALAQFECALFRGGERVAEGSINVAGGPVGA